MALNSISKSKHPLKKKEIKNKYFKMKKNGETIGELHFT